MKSQICVAIFYSVIDVMQEIPYQPVDDGSPCYGESEDKFKAKVKDETDYCDGISKEHKPVFCSGTHDLSKRDRQESNSKVESSTDRTRIKRKRDSGSDNSDEVKLKNISCKHSSSTNKDSYTRRSFNHKRVRQSPDNTKDDEDTSLSYPTKPDVGIPVLAGAKSSVKDKSEMFRCDMLKSEITKQVPTYARSERINPKNVLSEDTFKPIDNYETEDKTEPLTFLHEHGDSTSIDMSLNAAEPESLDLDNEFTLHSQKDKYDALEREYQHDGLMSTELSLSDEFTCDNQSFEST